MVPRFLVRSICLLAFAAAILPPAMASTVPGQSYLAFTRDDGFCFRGAAPPVQWEPGLGNDDAAVWGSYCDDQASTGQIISDTFLAPSELSFFISGYVGKPGLRLYLRNLQSSEDFDLRPQPPPGNGWRLYDFPLPPAWVGKPVKLIGEDNAKGLEGWFAFTAPRLPNSSLAAGYIPTDQAQHGFCRDSNFPLVSWGNNRPPSRAVIWRSFCSAGDQDTGFAASDPFIADKYAELYVAGYPGLQGLRLHLENLSNHQQLPLQLSQPPRELWQLYYFPLPREWQGQSIRVVADDNNTAPRGWIAFVVVPKLKCDRESGIRISSAAINPGDSCRNVTAGSGSLRSRRSPWNPECPGSDYALPADDRTRRLRCVLELLLSSHPGRDLQLDQLAPVCRYSRLGAWEPTETSGTGIVASHGDAGAAHGDCNIVYRLPRIHLRKVRSPSAVLGRTFWSAVSLRR